MSIAKKSLISTLKTTKKANAVSSAPEASHVTSKHPMGKVGVKQAPKVGVKQAPKVVVKQAPKIARA